MSYIPATVFTAGDKEESKSINAF